jgi:hypothetical protein
VVLPCLFYLRCSLLLMCCSFASSLLFYWVCCNSHGVPPFFFYWGSLFVLCFWSSFFTSCNKLVFFTKVVPIQRRKKILFYEVLLYTYCCVIFFAKISNLFIWNDLLCWFVNLKNITSLERKKIKLTILLPHQTHDKINIIRSISYHVFIQLSIISCHYPILTIKRALMIV